MPVTKAELERAKHSSGSGRIDDIVNMIEVMIDMALRTNYSGTRLVVQLSGALDPLVKAELQYRYTEAGWSITFHSNEVLFSHWIELE
jgi:hypothetical protein